MDKDRKGLGWVFATLVAIGLTVVIYVFEVEALRFGWFHFESRQAVKQVTASTDKPKPIITYDAGPAVADIAEFEVDEPLTPSAPLIAENNLTEPLEPAPLVALLAPVPDADADGIPSNEIIDPLLEATEPAFPRPSSQLVSARRMVEDELPANPSITQERSLDSGGWPAAPALIQLLDRLIEKPEAVFHITDNNSSATDIAPELSPVEAWHRDVTGELMSLWGLDSLSDEQSRLALERLTSLIIVGENLADSLDDAELSYKLRTALYALQRRVTVWQAIWTALQKPDIQLVDMRASSLTSADIRKSLQQVRDLVSQTGDAEGWSNYLLLQEIDDVLANESPSSKSTGPVARRFLARVTWQRLTDEQIDFLYREQIVKLREQLYPWAQQPVNYRRMLVELELLEEDPINRCRASLADSLQSLRFSPQPELVHVAHVMNDYYRNANMRLAVSKSFVERMLPKRDWESRPVRQNILGADTRGTSQVLTQLSLDFIPSSDSWQVDIGVNGKIMAQTRATKGPATVYNSQNTDVQTSRSLRLDPQELVVLQKGEANVQLNDRLKKFETSFDSLPVINQFFRAIVAQQVEQQRGVAQQLAKRIVKTQVDREFDKTLETQLAEAEDRLVEKVLDPLTKLNLSPLVVDLQTTEQRLLVRYRVAAQTQLAAHTPRPRAPSDSELSVQLHQSALNNTIAQFGLGDRLWPLAELCEKMVNVFGDGSMGVGDDIPENVFIRFAPYRPISVEFDRGKVWITLRIAELHQEGGIHLERFIVRTSYLADVSGLQAGLIHDGPISIDGYRLGIRERVPIRLIFSKVFSKQNYIPVLAPKISEDPRLSGLAVSQLEFRDGWLALALSSEHSPHIANVQRMYPLRSADQSSHPAASSTNGLNDGEEAVRLK
jgi:hypothetical protein